MSEASASAKVQVWGQVWKQVSNRVDARLNTQVWDQVVNQTLELVVWQMLDHIRPRLRELSDE